MYKVIGITNRHLCEGDYFRQIGRIAELPLEALIVREKDLNADEYKSLADKVMDICSEKCMKCILHSFYDVAEELGCRYIHLPLAVFREHNDIVHRFKEVGVSTHSAEEAAEAERLGAAYVTAGHIFETDCKKGLEPRGLEYLRHVCDSVNIPVYAIGGIHKGNMESAIRCGAKGVCVMSGIMRFMQI